MIRRIFFTAVVFSVAALGVGAGDDWVKLDRCELIPNPGNDGDSIHVRANQKEYIFRLYLVDAPETDAANPARLIEQAKYFGISVPQVIELGEAAKLFVQEKLAEPFAVVTHMANAMGRSKIERFYAFVQTKDGDLGEQLIANGLARIHGTSATPPGASSSAAERQRLEQLEGEAKRRKVGGWGMSGQPLNVASATPQPFANGSPSISVTPAQAAPIPSTSKNERLFPAKFDINTATEKELKMIPGIGPVMAARIIAARPFRSADDLKKVNGIGDKKYAQIRPYFQ
jgi:DNA uptake protein ComE-like DNA-binding protein